MESYGIMESYEITEIDLPIIFHWNDLLSLESLAYNDLRFGPSGAQAFVQDKVVDLGGWAERDGSILRLFQHTELEHSPKPSPTGYKGIPFIVG